MNSKIGEVIESTTTGFLAEAYELYNLPAFGSLVRVAEIPAEIFGIVCQAGTASIEPGRRPIARGKDEASEEAIYQSSPQLAKLLRSEFNVLIVGYARDAKIYQYLPSKPVHIHAFVHQCIADEVKRFCQSFDFMSLLLAANAQVPTEELIAAVLREMSRVQDDPRAFLVSAGKSLTSLLGGDYQRLRTILERMRS
jgi:hypothetical protein